MLCSEEVTEEKAVVNQKFTKSCCFGYITKSTAEDVDNVIANFKNTELNEHIIKIDVIQ